MWDYRLLLCYDIFNTAQLLSKNEEPKNGRRDGMIWDFFLQDGWWWRMTTIDLNLVSYSISYRDLHDGDELFL